MDDDSIETFDDLFEPFGLEGEPGKRALPSSGESSRPRAAPRPGSRAEGAWPVRLVR